MNLPDEIFIVVTEIDDDKKHTHLRTCPTAWETDLDVRCSKAEAIKRASRLSTLYGKIKIGRLVFDDDSVSEEQPIQHGHNKEVTSKRPPSEIPPVQTLSKIPKP